MTFRAGLLASLALFAAALPACADQTALQLRVPGTNTFGDYNTTTGATMGWRTCDMTAGTCVALPIFLNGISFNPSSIAATGNIGAGGNSGAGTTGLKVGGSVAVDGTASTSMRLEGDHSWLGVFPTVNYSPEEFAVHNATAFGQASVTAGGNTLTFVQGSPFDADWVGNRVYFNAAPYVVTAETGTTLTVQTTSGGAVSWPSTLTANFQVGYHRGMATCSVSGTTVTRIAGDPFYIYSTAPTFRLLINGVQRTVSAVPDDLHYTLTTAPGNLTSAMCVSYLSINDQFSTFRIHKTNVDSENMSLFARYDGYWIQSQYGSYGQYQPIRISSGELSYSPGSPNQQIVAQRNGDVTIGGDYGRDIMRITAAGGPAANYLLYPSTPTGYSPVMAARGTDTNVGMNMDAQGSGAFTWTSHTFGGIEFQVFGNAAGNWLGVGSDVSSPTLSANGSSTNVNIKLAPKGTGNIVATAPIVEPLTTPASSSAACTVGQFEDDASYHYVCTALNRWRRVALSDF